MHHKILHLAVPLFTSPVPSKPVEIQEHLPKIITPQTTAKPQHARSTHNNQEDGPPVAEHVETDPRPFKATQACSTAELDPVNRAGFAVVALLHTLGVQV